MIRARHGAWEAEPIDDHGRGALSDWTEQAADAVEKAVVLVRDKTVLPAQQGTKVVVYGFLTAFFTLTAFMLVTILLFRLLK